MVVWRRNASSRLWHLNIWIPAGGDFWDGVAPLMEEVCHWGRILDYKASSPSCVPVFEEVSSKFSAPIAMSVTCLYAPTLWWRDSTSGLLRQNKLFLPCTAPLTMFYQGIRKVTNTRYKTRMWKNQLLW